MAKTLSKKTLRRSFNNWFFWNGCSQQAESMLGLAFGQSMAPVIDELYEKKEDKAAGLRRHITLFNTESRSAPSATVSQSAWKNSLPTASAPPKQFRKQKSPS